MSEAASNAPAPVAGLVEAVLDEEHVLLTIDGVPYQVVTMQGSERVSTLFRFELTCADVAAGTAPFDLLGRSMELTLSDGFGLRRSIQGIVAEAERLVHDDGSAELRVVLRPNAYPLSLSRDSRVFNDLTVPQIVDRVIAKHPVPYRWELTRSYRQRVYTAQYREEDWTFVSRLLEAEGIYYWFDHEGSDSVLVLSDDSPNAPALTGEAPIEFVLDTGMLGNKELIHELGAEAHASATRFTVASFNPWNPDLKVVASEGGGVHEHYDPPGGGPEDPAICRHIARTRLECARSHRYTVSGNSSSIRIEPGRLLTVYNHPLHDGTYFVTEVGYSVRQRRRFAAETGGYECHFEAVGSDKPYRHPEETPITQQAGFQSGRVVGPPGEEIHTDDRGRVRVQLHWDREGGWDDKAGKWMRAAQRGMGMSMLYPRIGWNVMTFMEEGDVDAPTVLSRVHDAEHPPTYALPANKTRTVLRTETSPGGGSANEFRFEDLLGIQEMFINASRAMNYDVNNDAGYNVGRDNDQVVGGNHDLEIKSVMQQDVKNDQSMKITGNETVSIVADRDKNVSGNEKEDITGNRKIEIGSNVSFTVEKDRQLEVTGAVTEEATEGLIKASAKTAKVTISGSCTHTLDGVHQEQVTKDAVKSIKTEKIESCKQDYTVEVNGNLSETIKANLVMSAGKHFMDGSDTQTEWEVGGAIGGATKQVMLVQAKNRIVLKVGTSQLVITPTDVTLTASSYVLGNASVLDAKAGSKITQN
jgi:type VI secretion system secreted protein VgrG